MKSAALLALALFACDDSPSMPADANSGTDGAADGGFSSTCEGACRTTALTATFNATRMLDRAYYGVTAADGTLHIEVYRGGGTGCPTMNSPTPDYTLILGKVTRPTSNTPSSSPGNILDYQGDLLGGPLGAAATMVTITPVAASDTFVALDISLTFPTGTVTGHLYATHCDSLDTP